jgi:hypothetical protein
MVCILQKSFPGKALVGVKKDFVIVKPFPVCVGCWSKAADFTVGIQIASNRLAR